jgi:hypothetical protein
MTMQTNDRQEWRRIFRDTIMDLAGGEADVLQVASWAIQAQHVKGDRDPRQVATEEFAAGTPPTPD